jgi:hypothetical protein
MSAVSDSTDGFGGIDGERGRVVFVVSVSTPVYEQPESPTVLRVIS